MIYKEIKPKKELKDHIDCIWISDFTNNIKEHQTTVADGYLEIVFKFSQG